MAKNLLELMLTPIDELTEDEILELKVAAMRAAWLGPRRSEGESSMQTDNPETMQASIVESDDARDNILPFRTKEERDRDDPPPAA